MAQLPVNQKLYAMVVSQAKQKYRIYPSPGASHWVHQRYLELGGKFQDPAEENDKKRRAQAWAEAIHHHNEQKHYTKHTKRD